MILCGPTRIVKVEELINLDATRNQGGEPTSEENGIYTDGVGVELVDFKGDCEVQGEVAEVHDSRLNKQERIKDRIIVHIGVVEAPHYAINSN